MAQRNVESIRSIRRKYPEVKRPSFSKGAKVIFRTYDSELMAYNGMEGTVLNTITNTKSVDIFDVGWMYEVRLSNGRKIEAFEDELTRIKKKDTGMHPFGL